MKKNILTLFTILAFHSFLLGQNALYVNLNATGADDGSSWFDAYNNLQDAIDEADSGDSIYVAAGTYNPTKQPGAGSNQRDQTFLLKSGVRIFGGFSGNEPSANHRNMDSSAIHGTNRTILSGDIGVAGDSSDNAIHVAICINCSNGTILDGFTIEKGYANLTGNNLISAVMVPRDAGGGIALNNSDLMIHNCIISNNLAKKSGAGISNVNGSDGMIEDSWFISNKLWGSDPQADGGGGIHIHNSSPTIKNTKFMYNAIYDVQGGGAVRNEMNSTPTFENVDFLLNYTDNGDGGAGMYCASGSDAILKNVRFTKNTTTNQGAGMYNDNSKPHIEDSRFYQNHADGGGGAMESDGSSDFTMENVEIIENSTDDNGGGIQLWKSSPTLNNVRFIDNAAVNDGGGLFNYNDCSPVVSNTLFDGNRAGRNGGGMYNRRNCNPVITNVLIINNRAGSYGGGTYTVESNGSPCSPITTNATAVNNYADSSGGAGLDDGNGNSKLRNSIVMGNYSPNGADEIDAPPTSAATALFTSIIGDEYYVDGLTPPVIVTGPMFVDSAGGDYRLHAASYAVDRGDSTYFDPNNTPDISSVELDLQSVIRVMGQNIDLGAYEVCADTVNPSITIDASANMVLINFPVTFTAAVTNGGPNATVEWYVNGEPTGVAGLVWNTTAGMEYQINDTITAVLTTDACRDPQSALSNEEVIIMDIGIDEADNRYSLKVFPNPNNGRFYLSGDWSEGASYSASIINLNGKRLLDIQWPAGNKDIAVEMAVGIDPGMYFVQVLENGSPISTLRIIKN